MDFQKVVESVKASMAECTFRAANDKYYGRYVVLGVSDTEVCWVDRGDGAYGVFSAPYTASEIDGAVVVAVDFGKAVKKVWTTGDAVEGADDASFDFGAELASMTKDWVEYEVAKHESDVIKGLNEKINEMSGAYAALNGEAEKLREQVSLFLKEKEILQETSKKDAIDGLVGVYKNLFSRYGDFDEYCARLDYAKPKEQVEQECKILYANYCLAKEQKQAKASFAVISDKTADFSLDDDPMRARYGDAFDKF